MCTILTLAYSGISQRNVLNDNDRPTITNCFKLISTTKDLYSSMYGVQYIMTVNGVA